MKILWAFIKIILIIVGAFTLYYLALFQIQYNGVSAKIVAEYFNPTLDEKAIPVYMNIVNTLLDTGDITLASVRRVKVEDGVSNQDVEASMSSIATNMGIREVGILPLSEQVEKQLEEKQRFLKIYQYCSPTTAMKMTAYSEAFSAYLPCRIALVEDKQGVRWLYTLDMDLMIYGGAPLPPELLELALSVKDTIYAIQDGAARGDF